MLSTTEELEDALCMFLFGAFTRSSDNLKIDSILSHQTVGNKLALRFVRANPRK